MDSGELLSEALTLMVLGMGTVFVFLALLVLVTSTMSALVEKYAPAQSAGQQSPGMVAPVAEDQTLLAVIGAAIHAHRKRK